MHQDRDGSGDEYPERQIADTLVDVGIGLAGSIIPGGGALGPLIETTHARRLEVFQRRIAARVRELEQHESGFLLERATNRDQAAQEEILSTYSMIVRLVQEAMDEDKRAALAAAMASTLLWPDSAVDAERRFFLRCLSDFEAIHIGLLSRAKQGVASARELLNADGQLGETAKVAWQELYDRRMVSRDLSGMSGMMSSDGMRSDSTKLQGGRFLEFIGKSH